MTNREKAERYDALMTAIKYTLECYKERQRTHDLRYHEAQTLGLIGAYSKGRSDAYSCIIADLERWLR